MESILQSASDYLKYFVVLYDWFRCDCYCCCYYVEVTCHSAIVDLKMDFSSMDGSLYQQQHRQVVAAICWKVYYIERRALLAAFLSIRDVPGKEIEQRKNIINLCDVEARTKGRRTSTTNIKDSFTFCLICIRKNTTENQVEAEKMNFLLLFCCSFQPALGSRRNLTLGHLLHGAQR